MEQEQLRKRRMLQRTLDLQTQGLTPCEIENILKSETKRIGTYTETIAITAIKQIRFVNQILKPTSAEDAILKIDFYVNFVNRERHRAVMVQVKSSKEDLLEFMWSRNPKWRMIGLHVPLKPDYYYVHRQFLQQLNHMDGFI